MGRPKGIPSKFKGMEIVKKVYISCKYCNKKVKCYPSIIKQFCNKNCFDKYKIGKKRNDISKGLIKAHKNKQFGYRKGEQIGDKNPMKREDVKIKHKQKVKRGKDNYFYKHHFNGIENWNWQGGKSFEPYGLEFNEDLKRLIRERDKHICIICGLYGKDVHHIDYNKKNNNPNNLITLSHKCHSKTGHNRKKWIKYFRVVLNEKK